MYGIPKQVRNAISLQNRMNLKIYLKNVQIFYIESKRKKQCKKQDTK